MNYLYIIVLSSKLLYEVSLILNSFSPLPMLKTFKFEDPCLVPQLKLSLQDMTIKKYWRESKMEINAWSWDNTKVQTKIYQLQQM